MRRTPAYDPFDDHDDPSYEPPPNVRRISTTPGTERRRAEVRQLRSGRRQLPRRGPDPRVWFVRGAIGVVALAGLWLGLQALFPVSESQVSQAPAAPAAVDSIAVGAPEPPPAQAAEPAPVQAAPPAAEGQPAPVGDRLPGLPEPPAVAAEQPPAPAPAQAAAPAQPAAEAAPRAEAPSQQAVGKPTLAPIPPPPGINAQPSTPAQQQAAQQAAQQAVAAAPAPAPKPQAPPAAQATGGPFELAASASPVNPISEQANVTISIRATQNGAALAGVSCMATAYYRTNTVKQPEGGFTTNGNGVASFVLDARGTTYGYYVPVDVTCSGRGGTVTARTGFTPVRGR